MAYSAFLGVNCDAKSAGLPPHWSRRNGLSMADLRCRISPQKEHTLSSYMIIQPTFIN
jgi:hypothetical protein